MHFNSKEYFNMNLDTIVPICELITIKIIHTDKRTRVALQIYKRRKKEMGGK